MLPQRRAAAFGEVEPAMMSSLKPASTRRARAISVEGSPRSRRMRVASMMRTSWRQPSIAAGVSSCTAWGRDTASQSVHSRAVAWAESFATATSPMPRAG